MVHRGRRLAGATAELISADGKLAVLADASVMLRSGQPWAQPFTLVDERLPHAEVQGDRLRGELVGAAAADWLLIGPEGTGSLDVRVTFRTDDGAVIFRQYYGRSDVSRGLDLPATIYVAPRFETGDERYAWLNRIQAIGKGTVQEDLSLDYEWYEVR